jgi:2-dehydropantoate 2-reductase
MGGGAVGCYYGGLLARAGAEVTLIGRAMHVDVIARDGLWFEGLHFQEHVPMRAAVEVTAAKDAQLVLMCVKTPDTESATRAIAPHLAPDALVLSLQNGVENAQLIRGQCANPVVAAVVYVACAMSGPGRLKHTGRGDLVIGGDLTQAGLTPARVAALAALLERAGVPCKVSDNIEGELWGKLLINCAYNAISALGRARYHRLVALPETRALMQGVVAEVLAVAKAAGVLMPPGDWISIAVELAKGMPQATSSTAQDLARGKKTEIDHLNGLIVRRGRELGVDVPLNSALFGLTKLLEESIAG